MSTIYWGNVNQHRLTIAQVHGLIVPLMQFRAHLIMYDHLLPLIYILHISTTALSFIH